MDSASGSGGGGVEVVPPDDEEQRYYHFYLLNWESTIRFVRLSQSYLYPPMRSPSVPLLKHETPCQTSIKSTRARTRLLPLLLSTSSSAPLSLFPPLPPLSSPQQWQLPTFGGFRGRWVQPIRKWRRQCWRQCRWQCQWWRWYRSKLPLSFINSVRKSRKFMSLRILNSVCHSYCLEMEMTKVRRLPITACTIFLLLPTLPCVCACARIFVPVLVL